MKKRNLRNVKYIYALKAATDKQQLSLTGINKSTVYIVNYGKVAAVASDILSPKVRPERRNLAAHREVLKYFTELETVLPMRFGVITSSTQLIQRLLENNEELIMSALGELGGKVEMGLRVKWKVGNIYEYFVNHYPQLREARDKLLSKQQNSNTKFKNRDEKIAVGSLYEKLLNQERDAHQQIIEAMLQPCCRKIKILQPSNEFEILNFACLVDRANIDELEQHINDTATQLNNDCHIDFSGPWAPHNFVDLDLKVLAS
ncbi:GvpL/GvpF family gas vesicle protein [Endozoicomonas sp. SM1973]|uniref:GvpL/GvpF family gas vesicle protein n=1 Tax=Spartinivicinus marinus TaxID=2994442 RepID=A0A853I8D8_9GAMM|nr:GvpL/GvpF family gas vesicle protein [Spartinivicinus marinus]MCX4028912.1 GvpL/GvpF family gas vesicle protein [Spartinivicinus marinus]NYZ65505.1 GvpL/GvpF family gas vesicle protein [Spartinivicinus marinus]